MSRIIALFVCNLFFILVVFAQIPTDNPNTTDKHWLQV